MDIDKVPIDLKNTKHQELLLKVLNDLQDYLLSEIDIILGQKLDLATKEQMENKALAIQDLSKQLQSRIRAEISKQTQAIKQSKSFSRILNLIDEESES